MNLDQTTTLCRLLADPTRLRLLLLLRDHELTVAEITRITQLAQSRVSTHLAKLREAGLLRDRRAGVSVFYHFNDQLLPTEQQPFWRHLVQTADDPVLEEDRQRLDKLLADRNRGLSWADSVAGDMRRHYSPGRTWEATSRGVFSLLRLGDVLDMASGDGALAELLAPFSRSYTCVDMGEQVVEACKQRLTDHDNCRVFQADMHAVPLDDGQFDQLLLLHALTFSDAPHRAAAEAFRLLRPGGRLALVTLARHAHTAIAQSYNHLNNGFEVTEIEKLFSDIGFEVPQCELTSREAQPPHFEVITLAARKPA